MENYYNLFLDDMRRPGDAIYWEVQNGVAHMVEQPLLGWKVIRSYNDFVNIITKEGLPLNISFDHDLSDEHYVEGRNGTNPKYGEYKEKTGYECAKWLTEYCMSKNVPLPNYYVHSFNPVGRMNIFGIMESYKKWYKQNNETQSNNAT